MEKWKTIPNYPNYKVSNEGNVLNIKKNKLMSATLNKKGYLVVKLSINNKAKQFKIHRLVAQLFVNNFNNYDCVNHKDENKQNNHYLNLEWCNHQYNNTFGTRIIRQSESLKKNWKKRKNI